MVHFENKHSCVHCNRKSSLFEFLTREELELFNAHRHEVVYKPGETIFKQGTASTHAMSFVEGMAKMHIQGKNNNDLIIRLVNPVEFISGPGLYTRNRHHYSVTAVTLSHVCFIENNVFKKVLAQNTNFSEAFIRNTQEGLILSLDKLTSLHQKNQTGQLAEAILYLHNSIYKANPFTLTISKTELAELAGISQGSAYRILNQFHTDGLIQSIGDSIHILDTGLLEQVSENG